MTRIGGVTFVTFVTLWLVKSPEPKDGCVPLTTQGRKERHRDTGARSRYHNDAPESPAVFRQAFLGSGRAPENLYCIL